MQPSRIILVHVAQWFEYLTGRHKVIRCTHIQPSLIILVHVAQWLEYLTGGQKVTGCTHTCM